MKGYKAFDADFQCRGYQFLPNETFVIQGPPEMCERGFHFCERPVDVVKYYDWLRDDTIRFAEIEAVGEVLTDTTKSVTNKIRIVREIPIYEFAQLCTGTFRIGHRDITYYGGYIHNSKGPAILDYTTKMAYYYAFGSFNDVKAFISLGIPTQQS